MHIVISDLITLLAGLVGSTGFWAYVRQRDRRRDNGMKLLLGLAHDRIIHLGMGYIDRGSITQSEYEGFIQNLYGPYAQLGGNGLAKKVAAQVSELPLAPQRVKVQVVTQGNSNDT